MTEGGPHDIVMIKSVEKNEVTYWVGRMVKGGCEDGLPDPTVSYFLLPSDYTRVIRVG